MSIFSDHKSDEAFEIKARENLKEVANSKSPLKISFYPEKQNWHRAHDIFVIINSSEEVLLPSHLKLFWNHKDISKSFDGIKEVIFEDKHSMIIKIKSIMLLPHQENEITAYYTDPTGRIIAASEYQKPECLLNDVSDINNTNPFNVKKSFLTLVKKEASKANINPNLLTALIAQESGFNPKAVSYAKAVGLTQVTELANKHVLQEHQSWKSDSRINDLPAPVVRALINIGKISSKNDWRLSKRKSVVGGIEYIKYLVQYWNGNIALVERIYGSNYNKDQILTDLILASYNSGPYRIKSQLLKNGMAWKQSNTIFEARKYLGKIKSYCYHFAKIQEDLYENQTVNL